MKILNQILTISAAVILLYSCNPKSLTDLNKNPNSLDAAVSEYLFTGALLAMPAYNESVLGQGMQYFSTYKEVPAIGDKYFSFNGTQADFAGYYTDKLNRLLQLGNALTGPDDVNKLSVVRILRVYEFDQLTDVAGDIPYSQAMDGKNGLQPAYDTQKDIYLDMFKELNEAATALDPGKPMFNKTDLFYGGDVVKWKKFAYTLMLRLAMRLTERDAGLAEQWTKTAINGGVMLQDDDIAYISYGTAAGSQNPRVRAMLDGNYIKPGGDNVEGGKYTSVFINHLKSTNDPRLPVLSVVWVPVGNGYTADNSPSVQKGMVPASFNSKPADFDTYSEPSQLVLNVSAPFIILSPAESYLLLAEAALRNWYSAMTPKDAYEAAVRAAMNAWSLYPDVAPSSGTIPTSAVNAYIAANPYPASGSFETQLEAISVQKWVSLFGDDYEVYANWRRTGYPQLMPVNYPGNVTGGHMFRRFYVPNSEDLTNHDNYIEAMNRQGFSLLTGDNLQKPVWWDAR